MTLKRSIEPIAVTVLSGFLGSGKTTILNALLRAPHQRRIAVIVNEFGEVGIDGALVKGGQSFVELDNGCLCCALNEDLQTTLKTLVNRGDVDHIVIETTGLADPTPVAWTCTRPLLSEHLRVDAIVTVVDVANVERTLKEAREAHLQISRADLLVLNKLDLVDDNADGARKLLRECNTLAPFVFWYHDKMPWDVVLGLDAASSRNQDHARVRPAQLSTNAQSPADGHVHARVHAHRVDFESYTHIFDTAAVLDERSVEDIAFEIPEQVYRFKALVRVDAAEGPYLLVNGVAGRIDLRFVDPERPPEKSSWVFFGRHLVRDELRKLMGRLSSAD